MLCHHDIRTLREGGKFCQKCFSEWPSKVRKVEMYIAKMEKKNVAANLLRKNGIASLKRIQELPKLATGTAE